MTALTSASRRACSGAGGMSLRRCPSHDSRRPRLRTYPSRGSPAAAPCIHPHSTPRPLGRRCRSRCRRRSPTDDLNLHKDEPEGVQQFLKLRRRRYDHRAAAPYPESAAIRERLASALVAMHVDPVPPGPLPVSCLPHSAVTGLPQPVCRKRASRSSTASGFSSTPTTSPYHRRR